MITNRKYKNLTWIDVESPSQDEIRRIMNAHNIHLNVANELLSPSLKPKIESYENYIYLILHFPASKHTHSKGISQEIDFILSKDNLITVRYDTIDSFQGFAKKFEVSSDLGKDDFGAHAGFIFYQLLKKMYRSMFNELEYSSDILEKIEDNVFKGKEREMVKDISKTGRVLLDFKQIASSHIETLKIFEELSSNMFGNNFKNYVKDIISDHYRISLIIDRNKETLNELRETNNSLLSTKQNEVMKTLTIMAFVTFPLSLIAAIFGMNTRDMPIVGRDNDFWLVLGIMAILTLVFFILFKFRRWL